MNQLLILIFLIISPLSCLFAQQYYPEKINKRAVKLYEQAMAFAEADDLDKAKDALEKALKIDKNYMDAYLSLAGINGHFNKYTEAVRWYEKARSMDKQYFLDYLLPYSINLAGLGLFEQALETVQQYLNIPNLSTQEKNAGLYRERCYQFAVDYASNNPIDTVHFKPVNLGPHINTAVSEYFPSETIDGNELIFTRRVGNVNEDFYSSTRQASDWQSALPLTGNINTAQNEGAQQIAQDGSILVFTGCNFNDGLGSCDIYFSLNTKKGWSSPINIGAPVNTSYWESQPTLSPDKSELYFASSRPGGYGGTDLYVSKKQPDGRWGNPENLGAAINTAGDESCPFIHADNETLYFMSNGLPGYGEEDLYFCRRDSSGKWGQPENLGYPINTIKSEGSIFVTANGNTAYYASDKPDGFGGLDIYSFTLRPAIRPAPTTWMKGQVLDSKTEKGLPSMVELINIHTNRTVSLLQTDELGNFISTLPSGNNYALNVARKGYLFYSEHFALENTAIDSPYNRKIYLQPIEVNAKIVLHNVFFDVNDYTLKPQSLTELEKLLKLLQENPKLKIRINGHTDNTGTPANNLSLSENRAKVIAVYLMQNGIEKSRLTYKGFGETAPISSNETAAGKALNRRTEMQVESL